MAQQTLNRPDADENRENLRAAESGSPNYDPGQRYYDREFNDITSHLEDPEHPKGSPDNRPDLRSDEGLKGSGASDLASQARGDQKKAKAGNTIPNKDLRNAENEAADNPMNFTGGNGIGKRKRKGWLTKRRAKIAGGIAGASLGGGILGFSLLSGPFEFIHIAHILHDSHFSHQEIAGNGRMSKLYRYLRKGGSPGHTRLNYLSSKYYDRIIGKLGDIGIKPEYGIKDTFKGFTVDTEHENSPYKGMTPEEAAAAFEEKTGFKPTIDGKTLKVEVNSRKFFVSRKATNAMLSELDDSKVVTAVRIRVLGKFGMVSWHPMTKLDKFANESAAKLWTFLKDKWTKRIATGQDPVDVTADNAKNETTDKNGKTVKKALSDAAKKTATSVTDSASKVKGVLSDLASSKYGSIAGGLAAAAGVACALKAVNDNVAVIRYAQYILPAIRLGMDAITVGNQVESGRDFSNIELKFLSQYFSGTDPQTGQTTSWNDAMSIRRNYGQTGGQDTLANNGMKDLFTQSTISWLNWTEHLGPLCSAAGQLATGVLSIGLGILSGGVASTFAGVIIGGVLTGPIINKVSQLLAGHAMDLANIVGGAEWGSIADIGARFGANAAALGFGAVALTPKQSAQLDIQSENDLRDSYHKQSFFARAFSPYNYQSITSRIMDSNTGLANDITSIFSSVVGAGGTAMSIPISLLSSSTNAASVQPYNYGFPEFGFSLADQNNPLVQDPYANAQKAGVLLDHNAQNGEPDYIKKAYDCFGVNITDGPHGWDVIPATDINMYNPNKYNTASCIDSGNNNWLRIRFFIFDTGVFEGFACKDMGDATSCANDGFAGGLSAFVQNSATQHSTIAYGPHSSPFRASLTNHTPPADIKQTGAYSYA